MEKNISGCDSRISDDYTPSSYMNTLSVNSRHSVLYTPVTNEFGRAVSASSLFAPCTGCKTELKTKNYLIGSTAGGAGSMLGTKELLKIFPASVIDVQIITWNMASLKPHEYPDDLEELFFSSSLEHVANIFVVCIQETPSERHELFIRLQAAVGSKHVLFTYAVHGSLALAIFISRELIWYISVPQSIGVTTRAAVKTKGAVAICFLLFGTSMLFLSAHFKAHKHNLDLRIQDYQNVLDNLHLPKVGLTKGYRSDAKNPLDRFDAVFWAGDLNFRIDRPRENVDNILKGVNRQKKYDDLLSADQLLSALSEGTIFEKFDEGRIKFPPTYKFDINKDKYDSSEKQRVPSYTDRILFTSRKKGSIICVEYDSIATIRSSDHRPVFGVYSLSLKPGYDNIPLAAGLFHRDIYIAGNQRRALRFDMIRNKTHKTTTATTKTCTIN